MSDRRMSTLCPPITTKKIMTETEESIKLTILSGAEELIPSTDQDAEPVIVPQRETTIVATVTKVAVSL
jgi:hypothetical protein